MEALTPHAIWVGIIFLIGYLAIVIEQFIRVNKAATALFMAIACWAILFLEHNESVAQHLENLSQEMFRVTQVLFFLLGALIIVEIINTHRGFAVITKMLQVNSKRKLYLMTGIFAFFLSAVLDNLTTTVVMISIVRKLLEDSEDRFKVGSLVVIAANAGGAWTPIGDVATTLLWISGQLTAPAIVRDLFLPSVACFLVYLFLDIGSFKGQIPVMENDATNGKTEPGGTMILILGISALVFVPIFKILTGLPPFFGMMLGVAVLWYVTDLMHYQHPERWHLRVPETLPKVDTSVILFYLGVLLSIYALDSAHILQWVARQIAGYVTNPKIIAIFVGLASSVVDNVSLVAAAIGMYDIKTFPVDSEFWELLAYTAGTGGSIMILGSAAGVALMSLEKVDFLKYFKKTTPKALAAYFAGIIVYILIYSIV